MFTVQLLWAVRWFTAFKTKMPIIWIWDIFCFFWEINTLAIGLKPFLGAIRVTFQQNFPHIVYTSTEVGFPVSQPTHLLFQASMQQTISQLFSCACDKRLNQRLWSHQHRGVALQKLVPARCGDTSQLQHAEGRGSLQSGKLTDYLSSGLTQQPYSPSLLYPAVLRMVVCHDVTQFCFPLSQGGQGVSTFSPWRFSEAVSHKLYFCSFLWFSSRQPSQQICWWNIEHVAMDSLQH